MPVPDPVIVQGDARALQLPDESVDLIITSPPYWSLRSYRDGGEHYDGQIGSEPTWREYLDNLIGCTREWVRVLKPTGSLFINLGDKYGPNKSLMDLPWRYGIRCVDELGLIKRAEIIWAKANGLPESVVDRVRRSHEVFVHLTKAPRYFASVDEIREPHAGEFLSSGARNPRYGRPGGKMPWEEERTLERGGRKAMARSGASGDALNPLGKLPGSVWEIATQPLRVPAELGIDHFAAFPMEWPRRLILGWSPPDGVVLDPFGGTGTTAIVAHALGRVGISVDLSADYVRLAQWRANDPKQRERASRPAGSKPVAPKQQAPSTATSEPLALDLPA